MIKTVGILVCMVTMSGCLLWAKDAKPVEAPVEEVVDVAPVEAPVQDAPDATTGPVECPSDAKFCPSGCRPVVVFSSAGECRWPVVIGCSADLAHPELNPYTEVECYVMPDGALVHSPRWDTKPDWRICTQEEWNSMDLNFCP